MQTAPSKISQIKKAGEKIEKENKKPGFTIMDLVNALGWNTPQDKFYIQTSMTGLVRKGKAYKSSHTKPAAYTFQKEAQAPPKQLQKKSKEKSGHTVEQPVHDAAPDIDLNDATVDDFERIGVTPDMLGKAVFRIYQALQRQIINLEDELAQTKRKLDDANKRIGEQNTMIERHNLKVTGQKEQRVLSISSSPKNRSPKKHAAPHKLTQPTIVRIRKQD